ncbi:hypothetical protein WKK05_40230 (plasmid) [Nostoc sp. UHCC 0302]|uniref:hypothetical protein n=1 Tax=Nostoc sp. UHCC 0302 TaxID=3134896 RepID=UPI00311C9A95
MRWTQPISAKRGIVLSRGSETILASTAASPTVLIESKQSGGASLLYASDRLIAVLKALAQIAIGTQSKPTAFSPAGLLGASEFSGGALWGTGAEGVQWGVCGGVRWDGSGE